MSILILNDAVPAECKGDCSARRSFLLFLYKGWNWIYRKEDSHDRLPDYLFDNSFVLCTALSFFGQRNCTLYFC